MILCIDSGNSRIKWGLHGDGDWLETATVGHADSARMADLPQRLPMPDCVMLANVAGEVARAAIREALAPWLPVMCEAEATAAAGGVTNLYENPARLGVDRWCALIGARTLTAAPCVVVMAGTATTVDSLAGDGCFLGGLILPGLDLMRRSLARDTAALPLAAGKYAVHPRTTDDAITSGCIEAQAGAIERAFGRIAGEPGATCLLFGGGAAGLEGRLGCPHRVRQELILDGLLIMAVEI